MSGKQRGGEMTGPEISIVIPTFNRRLDLQQAIISIDQQRGIDFECVSVEDPRNEPVGIRFAQGIGRLRSELGQRASNRAAMDCRLDNAAQRRLAGLHGSRRTAELANPFVHAFDGQTDRGARIVDKLRIVFVLLGIGYHER